jgi:MFS family permease
VCTCAYVILFSQPSAATPYCTAVYTYTANAFPTRLRSIGTGWTDGVGHLGAWLGPVVAGHLFAATADHVCWILLITLPGALVPAVLLYGLGVRQRRAILEELST